MTAPSSPPAFGGMGADRDTLYDVAELDGGAPPPPTRTTRFGDQAADTPGGRWAAVVTNHPVRGPQTDGYAHPGSGRVAIWRTPTHGDRTTTRTADDRGWSLFYRTPPNRTLRFLADGTLSEMCELGDWTLLDG